MAWVLTKGLTTVRAEFSQVFPGRDRASDGSIGDPAHAVSPSGHNPDLTGRPEYRDGDNLDEVRAIDVDKDLVPGSAIDWMELVIQYLVRRGRAGVYIPFRYMIYKGRIWSRGDGWKTRTYTGRNKHSQHAHFSGDYTQKADNWTGSLGLSSLRTPKESGMAVTDADASKIWSVNAGSSANPVRVIDRINSIHAYSKTVHDLVQLLVNDDDVDEEVLAAAMAPAIAALVLPALLEAMQAGDGTPLTEEQVTEAVKRALRQGVGGEQPPHPNP